MSTTGPAPVLVCPGCGSRDVDLRRGPLCGTCADAVPVTGQPEPLVMPADEFTALKTVHERLEVALDADYWHKRWLAAMERADQDGAQAISQHVRILELERQLGAAEARLAVVRAVLLEGGQRDSDVRRRALAIIGTEEERS